ncbi:protein-(glutamine-N5) methyltransferase, release factor-specific [bacterium]|jgi:release factor glutamine methyltransferase|nr:protein-(glutamine-N5) methyltransferase, release factor-specific [bacterium]MDP6571687.1 peptide chain release factor N(5)-glutamine methyltransferase [Patescibacteria group bacterium]|tara:strand:- start:15182 stop:16012 length:831 start_codon:yes stop_codon:yes gene_type:complete
MTIKELLNNSLPKLSHLKSSHLDLEVLLSYVIDKPREYVLSHPNEDISDDKVKQFNDLVERRAQHEPIAYLTLRKEFYGRNFYINKHVHIPRPATEDMIDFIKQKLPNDFNGTIADIGTGSGCIAITLAYDFPRAKIIATDISQEALEVAQKNTYERKLEKRITLLKGDLLEPVKEKIDIIVANLPYGWQDDWTQDKETLHQPELVYNGGKDGLDLIKKLIQQLPQKLNRRGYVFLEFDPRQERKLKKLSSNLGYKITIQRDSQGFSRIAYLTLEH